MREFTRSARNWSPGLIIFLLALQACGTDPEAGVDAGTRTDVAGPCPAVQCEAGLWCVDAVCVPPPGCDDPDNDGFGEGGGCRDGIDCDPARSDVHPLAAELCDDVDNDCDGVVDESACAPCTTSCSTGQSSCSGKRIVRCDTSGRCPEWASPEPCPAGLACDDGACIETCIDADNDGFPVDCPGQREDCDDLHAEAYPGAPELCDELDNNCDGNIDERNVCESACEDQCTLGERICSSDARSYVQCYQAGRCTAWQAPRFCTSSQACVDGACESVVVCVDRDGDGAGAGCGVDDCRDADPASNIAADERCDGIDNNCDGVIDDGGVCASCPSTSAAAPTALENGAAYRQACAAREYFALPSGEDHAALVFGDGATVALGNVSGGNFVAVSGSSPLGGGQAAYAVGATVAEVSTVMGRTYALAVATDQSSCRDDAWEPNGAPFSGTPVGTAPFAGAATACSPDFDFYSLNVRTGDVIAAAAAFDAESGSDSRVQIWRNGTAVTAALSGPFVSGSPQGRHAHFRADLPGDYVVGVQSTGPTDSAYAVNISAEQVPCTDDANETNDGLDDDTIATARSLRRGEASGTLCPGDLDIIALGDFNDGSTLAFRFEVLTGGADIDFDIVHDSVTGIAFAGNSDQAVVDTAVNISTSGAYYLVVYGRTPGTTGTYTFAN